MEDGIDEHDHLPRDHAQANPLAMPEFSQLLDSISVHHIPGHIHQHQADVDLSTDSNMANEGFEMGMFLAYDSSAVEQDYMIFRYRWGRIVLTPSLCFGGIVVIATPLGLHRDSWFRWWTFYFVIIAGIMKIAVAAANGYVVYRFRNEQRLPVNAARLYELFVIAGGLLWAGVGATYYFQTSICTQDKLSHGLDASPCPLRIPIATLVSTVALACIIPCRAIIAVLVGCVVAPLLTFIVRLHLSDDTAQMLYVKLIVTLVITGAFAVLCVKRDLAHRHQYEMERATAVDNVRMKATQQLVVETLDTIFPALLVARLVSGLSVVTASDAVAIGVCDTGDMSLLSRFLSPFQIVSLLNELTKALDASIENRSGEKLKTFGDRFAFTVGLLCPAKSPRDAVVTATMIAHSFLKKHAAHPVVAALTKSNRAMLPLRTCIGFGPCTGGIVGVQSLSYEAFSPALTEIDSILPECPINLVVATDAAVVHCPELYGPAPWMTVPIPISGSALDRKVNLYKLHQRSLIPSAVEDPGPASAVIANELHVSGEFDGSIDPVHKRRHAELAAAIFKWGSALKRKVPFTLVMRDSVDEESVKDVQLDRALIIASSAVKDDHPSSTAVSLTTSGVLSSQMQSFLHDETAAFCPPLSGANYTAGIENLISGTKVKKVLIPRRYSSDELELLFEEYERPLVVNHIEAVVRISGVFFAAILLVVLTADDTKSSHTAAVTLLSVAIALCAGLSVALRLCRGWLMSSRYAARVLLFIVFVFSMFFTYAGISLSGMTILQDDTGFALVLLFGLIASCTTRLSHAFTINVLNAVGNSIVLRNSPDVSTPVVVVYAVCSFMCIFTPLEVERSLRRSFELNLLGSALRRGLCEELAVASTILHHALPHFVAHRVLQHGQSIANFSTLLPSVCVLAIRVDGFSRSACDERLQADTISVVDDFVVAVEEILRRSVAKSLAMEGEIAADVAIGERARRDENNSDILVKVSAFGDKIVVFGPLVEGSCDWHLRSAARAMLLVAEEIHRKVSQDHPTCLMTSMATFDSGLVVAVGRTRCTPIIRGVAARQADLLLRAAPDGFNGVASSFGSAVGTMQLDLPLPDCRWRISEHSECWRVRGAGTTAVHRYVADS